MARIYHGFTPGPTSNKQESGPKEVKQPPDNKQDAGKARGSKSKKSGEGGGE